MLIIWLSFSAFGYYQIKADNAVKYLFNVLENWQSPVIILSVELRLGEGGGSGALSGVQHLHGLAKNL